MRTVAFRSQPLPAPTARALRVRLVDEHGREPFSALDARGCVRRVAAIAEELGLRSTVYRGGLDLRGSEVDHLWLDVSGRVVDVAYPLFVEEFVAVLRGYVAGDAGPGDIASAAALAGVDERVVGEFPAALAYRGTPVWSARARR